MLSEYYEQQQQVLRPYFTCCHDQFDYAILRLCGLTHTWQENVAWVIQ